MGRLIRRRIQSNPAIAAWLFDHLIRPRQNAGWNRKTDLLGSFQIDDELELLRGFNYAPFGIL
jgi:hypothetical protein